MDKKMMDKINEVLKANGRRELSMEESEQVAGGSFSYNPTNDMCCVNGKMMSGDEFNTLIFNVGQNFGYTAARDTLYGLTGYMCTEMGKQFRWDDSSSDMEREGVIMNRFWANYRDGAKY